MLFWSFDFVKLKNLGNESMSSCIFYFVKPKNFGNELVSSCIFGSSYLQ